MCGQPKRFLPWSGVFFFLCVWTARLHGFSLWGVRPPPGGKGGPERRRTLSAPKTLFSEKPFSRGYSFETVLDMVMGIIDASLPPTALCMYLVYVRGLVRECSDRVDACACDLWADFLGAFVCE